MAEPNAYLDTLRRMEPDVAAIDASAFYASAAISLRRIADLLEDQNNWLVRNCHVMEGLVSVLQQATRRYPT